MERAECERKLQQEFIDLGIADKPNPNEWLVQMYREGKYKILEGKKPNW